MKTLIIHRTHIKSYSENKFSVLINGKLVARLKDNETFKIEVEDDTIEIQAKSLKWFGSQKQTITVKDKTTVNINSIPNFYNQTLIYSNLFIAVGILLNNFLKSVSYILAAVGLGTLVYSLIFGRNKWLTLEVE